MPFLSTTGAASAKGFGNIYQQTAIAANGWMARIGIWTGLLTSDADNNIYCTGTARGGTRTFFKIGSDGALAWQKAFPLSPQYNIYTIQSLSTGLISVAGSISSSGSVATFLNNDGTVSSSRLIASGQNFSSSASTSSGSLYASFVYTYSTLARFYNGSIVVKKAHIGSNCFFSGGGASDTAYVYSNTISIGKVDSNLSFLWKIYSSSFGFVQAVESNGFVYAISSYLTSNLAIVKFDASTGVVSWAKYLPSISLYDSSTLIGTIAVDNSDNVYVTGRIPSTTTAGVFKISSSGSLVWARSVLISGLSTFDYTTVPSIVVNNTNNTICIQAVNVSSSINYSILLSVPNDGTLTGTYTTGGNSITYSVYSKSLSTVSTSFALSSQSLANVSITDASTSITLSTPTNTYSKISIP